MLENIREKTVVVTGGAGFIGSHIVEELVGQGATVIVIDNLKTGRKENIAPFLEKITFIEEDICESDLPNIFKGVDYILHQAAIPSVPRSIQDPLTTNRTNIEGMLKILLAARESGVQRVVYASSSSVYGPSADLPASEDAPTNPISPYAIQKATGEMYAQNFSRLFGLETVGLRYFNIFGPRQDPSSKYSAVIPLFITKMLEGESPTIFGDGTTSRDFTFVKNVVQANIRACVAKDVSGEVFNIATSHPVSLNTLVEDINDLLGKDISPLYEDFREGDIHHSHANISKAEDILGYTPTVDFKDGLALTVEHFQRDGIEE